jgi:hypothetical protein
MKQATIILAILLGFAVTSCDNGGDKTMYLQAQMVNHIGIAAFESEYTGTYRADAAVYEVVLDTENGKADVACRITLPTGKMGTIDLRGMSLSVDAKTGGYYIKQTADTRSQGSYTVTNFSGIIDLTSSTTSKSHFSFIVENHYQVNATIAEMRFTGVTADIKDADGNMRTLSNGTVVTTLNPTTKKASITITGLDYFGAHSTGSRSHFPAIDCGRWHRLRQGDACGYGTRSRGRADRHFVCRERGKFGKRCLQATLRGPWRRRHHAGVEENFAHPTD